MNQKSHFKRVVVTGYGAVTLWGYGFSMLASDYG